MGWKKGGIIDHDPVLGRTETFWYNDDTDEWGYETTWDWSNIIEDAKGKFNATDERAGWKGDLHRVASVPVAVHAMLMQESHGGKDQEFLRRWLNDPDNRAFRTRPGRV